MLSLLTGDMADYLGKGEQVAMLTDRVAANTDQPQLFGSQVGCADGEPVPRPDLARPGQVDQLRVEVGLEPLKNYLARFDQHCADLAQVPIDAGCQPLHGANELFEPNAAVLVGELHGTVESPAFVATLACTALSYGYDVTVGLEIPDDETTAIEAFLASDGGTEARRELLAQPFWNSEFADGRQSTAMLNLLDKLRQHTVDGAALDVVLLDATAVPDRDVAMADRLLAAIEATPDGFTIALTGNLHNRAVRGVSFDPDYEPMGYLVKHALADHQSVRTLDVRYSGGAAWNCTQQDACRPHTVDSNVSADTDLTEAVAFVELFTVPNNDGFDGTYFVGDLSPAAPAVDAEDVLDPP